MMPSTLHRRRAAFHFSQCYEDFCCSHGACPLSMVTARSKETWLECSGERVRPTDWIPLCKALQMNKSLELVRIAFDPSREQLGKSRRGQSAPAGVKPGTAGYQVAASRMDRSAVVRLVCRSLGSLIRVSPTLTVLGLEGVWLRFDDITLLAKGLSRSSRLQTLSLAHCRIGDSGAEVLCAALQCSRAIQQLDLSSCGLTWKSAPFLAKLIEQHANWRYAYLWQASLRQVRANTDGVSGLRRLTLCANPLMGDRSVNMLMDTLQDDIWIKAVDMQHCGVSNIGVRLWLNLLRSGGLTLLVVDLRQNPLADRPLIRAVMEQIVINGHGINDDPQFQWLSTVVSPTPDGYQPPPSVEASRSRSTTRKTHHSKPSLKSGGPKPTTGHHRSRSVESDRAHVQQRQQRPHSSGAKPAARRDRRQYQRRLQRGALARADEELVVIEPVRGLPWRTAARCALRKRTRSVDSAPIDLHFSPSEQSPASSSSSEGEASDATFDVSPRQPASAAKTEANDTGRSSSKSQGPPRSQSHASPTTAASRGRSSQRDTPQSGWDRRGLVDQPDRDQHGGAHSTLRDPHSAARSSRPKRHRRRGDQDAFGNVHDSHTMPDSEPRSIPNAHGDGAFVPPRTTGYTADPGLHHRHELATPTRSAASAPPRHACFSASAVRAADNGGVSTGDAGDVTSQLHNPSLAGLQAGTSLDDDLLQRFEGALNRFSEYLSLMRNRA